MLKIANWVLKPDAKYSIIRPMYGDIFRLYNKAGGTTGF